MKKVKEVGGQVALELEARGLNQRRVLRQHRRVLLPNDLEQLIARLPCLPEAALPRTAGHSTHLPRRGSQAKPALEGGLRALIRRGEHRSLILFQLRCRWERRRVLRHQRDRLERLRFLRRAQFRRRPPSQEIISFDLSQA